MPTVSPTPPPATLTPVPGFRLSPPGTTAPPATSVVRVPSGEVSRPATVHGILKDDRGRPVSDAVVLIGGKHVETSHATGQEGFFVVAGVPSGRQPLIVTKDGFVPLRQFVELKSGAVEKLSLTMQRSASPPSPPFQHRPIVPRSGGGHQSQ